MEEGYPGTAARNRLSLTAGAATLRADSTGEGGRAMAIDESLIKALHVETLRRAC